MDGLPWAQDDLSEFERHAIAHLTYIGKREIAGLSTALGLAWIQDDITAAEADALEWMSWIAYYHGAEAGAIIGMPFLESLESDDVLALQGIYRLARLSDDRLLSSLLEHPTLSGGIVDDQTTLVAAVSTVDDAVTLRRLLIPGYVYIKTFESPTELSPDLKISIVRAEGPPQHWTRHMIRDAVEYAERIMARPLPVSHVILIINDAAVLDEFAGTNFGFAISGLPRIEEGARDFDKYRLSQLILHEISHYFWRGSADWLDEGVADTFEFMHGIESGMSPGLLSTPSRRQCEAHDLQMLTQQQPTQQTPQFLCNYFLGQALFLDLLEDLGSNEFHRGLRELYRLSLVAGEEDRDAGIHEVRQAFPQSADIVEKHWSGKLNAPENRPFDEGIGRLSHRLIQWDEHPTYDGDSVTFRGTLLDDAVLSKETLEYAQQGGYTNYTLHTAETGSYVGSILPALDDGSSWDVDDSGDTVAAEYLIEGRTFSVIFQFPENLKSPSGYVVSVWGFQDGGREPFFGRRVDLLGYARIRMK